MTQWMHTYRRRPILTSQLLDLRGSPEALYSPQLSTLLPESRSFLDVAYSKPDGASAVLLVTK